MGEGRTQSAGVGKRREWGLCCAPQMEEAQWRGHSRGMDTPAPSPASDLCLSAASRALPLPLCANLAALCSVSGEQFSRSLSEVWIVSAQNMSWLFLRPRQRSSPLTGLPKSPDWQHYRAEAADSASRWGVTNPLAGVETS